MRTFVLLGLAMLSSNLLLVRADEDEVEEAAQEECNGPEVSS